MSRDGQTALSLRADPKIDEIHPDDQRAYRRRIDRFARKLERERYKIWKQLDAIEDPMERAIAASEQVQIAVERADAARRIRDDAIHACFTDSPNRATAGRIIRQLMADGLLARSVIKRARFVSGDDATSE